LSPPKRPAWRALRQSAVERGPVPLPDEPDPASPATNATSGAAAGLDPEHPVGPDLLDRPDYPRYLEHPWFEPDNRVESVIDGSDGRGDGAIGDGVDDRADGLDDRADRLALPAVPPALEASGHEERPPMATSEVLGVSGILGDSPADADAGPTGVMPTGQITLGATADEPLPTGSIPVDPMGQPLEDGSPVRVVLQSAVVALAALLVGLVVFTAVRSAVGGDDPDVAERDDDRDVPTIDPGPGDPGGNEDRLDSDRATADLGDGRDDDGTTPSAERGPDAPGEGDDIAEPGSGDIEALSDQDSTSIVGAGPAADAGTSGAPPPAGPSTSPDPLDSFPRTQPTTPSPSPSSEAISTSSTRRSTTSTRPLSTAGSSTPATVASTTTTRPTTSPTPPPAPPPFLASPANGTVASWESALTFTANPVAGATQYCWAFSGVGDSSYSPCTTAPTFQLSASRRAPGAGPITLDLEARNSSGAVLRSQRIGFTLVASDIITTPSPGGQLDLGRPIRLSARSIPNATRYCWVLSQGTTATGSLCGGGPNLNLKRNDPILAPFGPGSVTVRATAENGPVELGSQIISAQFVD
jgi:hypothetical protein